MGSRVRSRQWNVYSAIPTFPATPETLMSEINTAIANLECARASSQLESPKKSLMLRSRNFDVRATYDARSADEAYRAGCAALAAGKLDEALHFLSVSLSKCPPDRVSAVAKLQSLINLTSRQLHKSSDSSEMNHFSMLNHRDI